MALNKQDISSAKQFAADKSALIDASKELLAAAEFAARELAEIGYTGWDKVILDTAAILKQQIFIVQSEKGVAPLTKEQ